MKKFILVCLLIILTSSKTKTLTGIASFYHDKFEGRRTANGEIFRQVKMTAASNNFPLGSTVFVTNLKNNKSVTVRINDRMAKRMSDRGRIIDLSTSSAKAIGFNNGLIKVKVEKI